MQTQSENAVRHLLLVTIAASALAAVAHDRAHAAPLVRLDFTGVVEIDGPASGNPLSGVVAAGGVAPSALSAVSGYLLYDAGTPAASLGVWNLPTATYHANFGNLTIDATGLTAAIGSIGSFLSFSFAIPNGEFPFPVTAANGSLAIQAFRNGAFDPLALPTAIPAVLPTAGVDETTSFTYVTAGGVAGNVSTDSNLRITATVIGGPTGVPEPASLLLLGAGLTGLGAARRRQLRD